MPQCAPQDLQDNPGAFLDALDQQHGNAVSIITKNAGGKVRRVGNTAIDIGKKRSHIVVEQDGEIIREGYVDATADGLREYLSDVSNPVFIVEASSTLDGVANYQEPYGSTKTVAHPMKVKAIAQSMKKTDWNDAHVLLEMNRLGCVPESYQPDRETRRQRNNEYTA